MSRQSQWSALKALTKASLQSILKSPSAIVFSVAFPLVFIVAFGLLGGNGNSTIKVVMNPNSDTNNAVYQALRNDPQLKWLNVDQNLSLEQQFRNGALDASIDLSYSPTQVPHYQIVINGVVAHYDALNRLKDIISKHTISSNQNIELAFQQELNTQINALDARSLKSIDFILPGQLGFSLLAGSIFGTAFIFFNMRQTLVLKRFFATPVRRPVILFSEGIARLVFQIVTAIIIIAVGYYVFDYYLIHGMGTVLQMLFFCILGVMVFMGFGFTVSGLAKSEASIPPLANMITMPQFLLAGTFFPISSFPKWLQPLCNIMPLTYLNDALRRTAFDGASLWTLRWDILILLAWGLVIYFLASRVFRWE